MKRDQSDAYNAQVSQDNANQLANNKGRKYKYSSELLEDIQEKLELTWSPEQIVGHCYDKMLSFKSMYNWIYKGIIKLPLDVLRHKGKSRQPQETRGKFNIGTPISKRPKSVKKRTILIIGNSIRWSPHAVKVKVALPHFQNGKAGCILLCLCPIALKGLCIKPLIT